MGRFDVLSDYDFEELAADLLRAETGLLFRAGTRGRDGGVDLLAIDGPARHVAQCKHYRTGDFGRVVQKARQEAERLRSGQLVCQSYRFVTSMRLPQQHYDDIVGVLSPWIDDAGHVLGESDLEHLLRIHPDVEGRHVKLWISGAGAFRKALNAGAYTSSQALLHEIAAALPRYVQTDAFSQARDVLDRHHVSVIAGPPGVGKTTLAHLLAVDAVERGHELFDIPQGGIADAWGLLDANARQIFLYDDFLGRIALSPKHEDDHALIRFMRQVARSPNSRMVLTTREYILRQAQHLSEVLDDDGSGLHPFLVHLDGYDRFERALIFYNHVYFSKKVDAPKRLALAKSYDKIIDHPNYNPRLVEWMTSMADDGVGADADRDYVAYCVEVLDHPRCLWRKAFMDGLDDADRVLLLTLASLPEPVAMPTLEAAFLHACQTRGIPTHDHRLPRSLSTLEGSFVTIRQLEDGTVVAPRNPSLLDFLRDYLLASNPDVERMLEGVLLFEQAGWVWDAASPGGDDVDDIFDIPEPPADALLPAFARAFERTFDRRLDDDDLARPISRIVRLVDVMQRAPALIPLVRPGSRRPHRRWSARPSRRTRSATACSGCWNVWSTSVSSSPRRSSRRSFRGSSTTRPPTSSSGGRPSRSPSKFSRSCSSRPSWSRPRPGT
jgi:DNA polymerase III delta prime subunit